MRESERLLELARKAFEDAVESKDPAQMKVHAAMGHHYLEQAEAAAAREKKSENGERRDS
jgi:Tfp pilus assembly protein PilF